MSALSPGSVEDPTGFKQDGQVPKAQTHLLDYHPHTMCGLTAMEKPGGLIFSLKRSIPRLKNHNHA